MADLKETARWEAGIYQWETSDPVMGGENGIDNLPTRQLANRTVWLKEKIEAVQGQADAKLPLAGGTATGKIAVRYNHEWVGFAAEQPTEGKNVFFDGIVGDHARGGLQIATLGNGRYEARIQVTPEGATDHDRRIAGMTITDKHIHTAAYGNLHDYFAAKTDLQRVADGKADNGHRHGIGDIENLQNALNGKTDSGHRHSIADIDNLQPALNGKFSVAGGNLAGSIAIRAGAANEWQGVALVSAANAYFEKRRANNIALGGFQVLEHSDGSASVKLQATPSGEIGRDRRVDILVGTANQTTVHHNAHRTVFESDGSIRVLDNRGLTVWHSRETLKRADLVQRRTHSRTINAPNAAYATETMQVDGETVVGADGSVVQYFVIRGARFHWFNLEKANIGNYKSDYYASQLEIDLWTPMPNKVLYAQIQFVRASSETDSPIYWGEASEILSAWYPKETNNSRAAFHLRRWHGALNEPIDIVIKVEGY